MTAEAHIIKVVTPFSDSGEIGICDAIEHQGSLWLVPHWIDTPATDTRTPVRIVRVPWEWLKKESVDRWQYSLQALRLSKAVLMGHARPEPPVEVVESPALAFRLSASRLQ